MYLFCEKGFEVLSKFDVVALEGGVGVLERYKSFNLLVQTDDKVILGIGIAAVDGLFHLQIV